MDINHHMKLPRKTRGSVILDGGIEKLAQFASDITQGETTPRFWINWLNKPVDEPTKDQLDIQCANEALLNTGKKTYPIQVTEICQNYGFTIFEEYLNKDLLGLIVSQCEPYQNYGTNKVIIVNLQHPLGQRRFSIAKELGHYLLFCEPGDMLFVHRDIGLNDEEEQSAALFALNLLMPEATVYTALANKPNLSAFETICFVADAFAVTHDAAYTQLERLGII